MKLCQQHAYNVVHYRVNPPGQVFENADEQFERTNTIKLAFARMVLDHYILDKLEGQL